MHDHFDRFFQEYDVRYQPRLGFLGPVIQEVVEKYLDDPVPDYDTEPLMMNANG